MISGGPKDTITSLWTKGLKALVPPNSFGPPTMVGVVVDFKDRESLDCVSLMETSVVELVCSEGSLETSRHGFDLLRGGISLYPLGTPPWKPPSHLSGEFSFSFSPGSAFSISHRSGLIPTPSGFCFVLLVFSLRGSRLSPVTSLVRLGLHMP